MDTTYRTLPDEDAPSVVTRYAPDEDTARVVFGDVPPGEDYFESICEDAAEEWGCDRCEDSEPAPDGKFWHYDELEESPEWYSENFSARIYKRTDGWRGYYDTPSSLRTISEGWATGYPDESTRRKLTLIELGELLEDGELVPPAPLYWLTEPTSNVFSIASELLVAEADYDEVTAWLESVGFSVQTLERAHT